MSTQRLLQPGDVVVLKSGGPRMTVFKVSALENKCSCVWFDSTNQVRREEFQFSEIYAAAEQTSRPVVPQPSRA